MKRTELDYREDKTYGLIYTRMMEEFEVDGIRYVPPMVTDRNSGVRSLYHHSYCPMFNIKGDCETSETAGFRWHPFTDRDTHGLFGAGCGDDHDTTQERHVYAYEQAA